MPRNPSPSTNESVNRGCEQSPRWLEKPLPALPADALEKSLPPYAFKEYWRAAIYDLLDAYDHVCAYSCFRIHPITGGSSVDHFVPKSQDWDKVYEWSNYRLACTLMNTRKRDFQDVLDPCAIKDGWFQLELTMFQVVPARDLPPRTRSRVVTTIDRLRLNDGIFREYRAEYARYYWENSISFDVLEQNAPFVARELSRQNRLVRGEHP